MTIENEKCILAGVVKFVELWDQTLAHPVSENRFFGPTVWGGHAAAHPMLDTISKVGYICSHVFGVFKVFNLIPRIKMAFTREDECRVKCHPFSSYHWGQRGYYPGSKF